MNYWWFGSMKYLSMIWSMMIQLMMIILIAKKWYKSTVQKYFDEPLLKFFSLLTLSKINSSFYDCKNGFRCAHFNIFNLILKIRISHFQSVLLLPFDDLSIDRVLAPRRDLLRNRSRLSLARRYNRLVPLYSCLRVGCGIFWYYFISLTNSASKVHRSILNYCIRKGFRWFMMILHQYRNNLIKLLILYAVGRI